MSKTTVHRGFKKGEQYGLKHIRTRRKFFLKDGPNWNSKKRCSGCKKPVEKLRPDRGIHSDNRSPVIALHCPRCEVIFPAYRKVVSIFGDD